MRAWSAARRYVPLLALGVLALASPGGAQISPGELSTPHATLEGSANCLSCHQAEKGVDAALCLSCHGALAERVKAGAGLHAGEGYRRCERCHSEHNGREFALVHWPGGEPKLDHALAGWPLEGRHSRLACRDCHRADRVSPRLRELEPKKALARTYLGLDRSCTACHADPHRGSMKAEPPEAGCAGCHGQESWKAPRTFDHTRTRFALDATHARVACAACHKQPAPVTPEAHAVVFDQYRGRASAPACSDCHRDPHEGRLGGDCARCHSGGTFKSADRRAVDHERTAYPLRGRHRDVACERCHTAERGLRIARAVPIDRCESCHRDPHFGQLASAAGATGCTSCHSVDAWTPARYGIAEHDRARFPLAGAHRAVPCSACHAEVTAAELAPAFQRTSGAGRERIRRFRLAAIDCADCHRDPHAGELARWSAEEGCRACHDQERWRPARFDHSRTRFALLGGHGRATCDACHPRAPGAVTAATGERRFAGRPLDCAGCHRDVHEGQLAKGGVTDCARCHSIDRFRPAPGFDHAGARFRLDGRHVGVACARCHPTERGTSGEVVRYAPRPLDCAGCHTGAKAKEGRS